LHYTIEEEMNITGFLNGCPVITSINHIIWLASSFLWTL